MFTIRELCEKSNLSRSTILYYHSIGLLSPVMRNESNYRLYSEDSLKQLERICTYREAGVPLNEITKILCLGKNAEREILERTLEMLNSEVKKIKKKQKIIISMLEGSQNLVESINGINKDLILESLRLLGIDEDGLVKLHSHLEKTSPEAHKAFLEALEFSEEEIKCIRKNAQKDNNKV